MDELGQAVVAGTLAGVQSVPATLYNLEPWWRRGDFLGTWLSPATWRMLGDIWRCAKMCCVAVKCDSNFAVG
jgi:hypothetical protein